MRLIIISNRAPISIIRDESGYHYSPSSGGLASGLNAYVEKLKVKNPGMEVVWMGWPGGIVDDEVKVGAEISEKYGVHSVFLGEAVMERFYDGFCNKTIWPLFHYFPVFTIYDKSYWEEYISVNQIFCDELLKIWKPGDTIWVQDYHLMLLPAMIRKNIPEATIGFFLHIPFPSYEVFRLLPSEWRVKIIEGLFGADLIGFHTFDYRTYFLRSTLHILGLTEHMGEVLYGKRLVKVDSFPMGIDYDKYHQAAKSKVPDHEKIKVRKIAGEKFILSIDRQDYSKGILNRLRAYEYFLQTNTTWKNKVVMMLIVVPSRIGVESYQSIKSQIDELVGHINGTYGNLEWQPIHYQYRSLTFVELIALYNSSDIALITPLRDGMNLISKEFIASRTDKKGVLILSEMTGAAQELDEAIIINPNNIEEISQSMIVALEMSEAEQGRRLAVMQNRIKGYNVFVWAEDFLTTLDSVKKKQDRLRANMLDQTTIKRVVESFRNADERFIFLDYDGTLVEHKHHPIEVIPDEELLVLLLNLTKLKRTSIIVISGRNRTFLDQWFGKVPISLVAEHGVFIKENGKDWKLLKPVRKNWKKKIAPILHSFVEKLSGSFVEEKEYSIAFHYRKSEPELASLRVKELMNQLMSFTSNMDVQMIAGSKTLEIRNSGIDKGVAAMHWLGGTKKEPRFVLAIGNDQTDEDLFRSLPLDAYTIKVGTFPSYAKYNLNSPQEVREFLDNLTE